MTRTSSSPYEIGHLIGTCASTGRALAVGEPFVAVVVEGPDGTLSRADFAAETWEGGARPAGPVFAAWRSVVPEPGGRPRPLIDDDELMDLFERDVPEDDESRLAFRYLLALVLIRKRRLTYEGGTPGDARKGTRGTMLVRARGTTASGDKHPVITVVDPGLTDDRAGELAEQLDLIMNTGDEGGEP